MRFFTIEPGGGAYRIHKDIRDMMVFAEHSVIKDPPFTKIDFVSCRNLLIYIGADLQKQLIPLFHYALNLGGFLFLGTSESVGEFMSLFDTLDRGSKLYQRKESIDLPYPGRNKQRGALNRVLPPLVSGETARSEVCQPAIEKLVVPKKLSPRELTEWALMRIAPAGALVNGNGSIIYLQGRTGLYLEPAQGVPGSSNILKMAREGLREHLTIALRKAASTKEIVHSPGVHIKTDSGQIAVNLTVHPVTTDPFGETQGRPAASPASVQYLVILEEAAASPGKDRKRQADKKAGAESSDTIKATDIDARIAALQLELGAKEEYIQTSNEELQGFTEELKSANEEMQSVNEELQSSNEELETSKEELQSVNEELLTVNTELQDKVADLSRANNDMNNLIACTGIGTIFVDHALTIQRFTPTVTQIMNIILSDLGRPVSHIASNIRDYNHLSEDVKAVLDTLTSKEIEVQTTDDKWYSMRILPYRTLNNVIEGAVITFVDITGMKQMHVNIKELEKAQEALRESERMLQDSQAVAHIGAYITNLTATEFDTNTWQASPEIYKIFGIDITYPHTLEGWIGFIHPDSKEELFAYHKQVVLERKRFDRQYKIIRINDGEERWVQGTGELVYDEKSNPIRMLGTIQDITERKREEEALRESREKYSTIFDQSPIAIEFYNSDGGLISVNSACINLFGVVNRNEISGFKLFEDPNISTDIKTKLLNRENVRFAAEFNFEEVKRLNLYQTTCSGIKILDWSISPLTNGNVLIGYIEQIQDITERKQLENELKRTLQKTNALLHLAVTARDAHDAITVQDLEGRIIAWNPAAVRMYGWSEVEALAMNIRDLIQERQRKEALAKIKQLSQSEILEPYRTQRIAKDGSIVEVSIISTALVNETGQMYAIATTERAIKERN
jgi:two-component system CheB/CheR fusion protein